MANESLVPTSVAIICDGNRRWARKHGYEVFIGHRKATDEIFEQLIDYSIARGIKYLTFWVFSTENWTRDKKEVDYLMNLFREFFDKRMEDLDDKGVRVKVIGYRPAFAKDIQERIAKGEERTKDNDVLTLTLAMNYGGRDEITRAVKVIAQEVKAGKLDPEAITSELISEHLDTSYMPDPDLIICTSGELRMSGFMPWQSNYSEFAFPECTFPEFTSEKMDEVLASYAKRDRRFGGK